MKLSINKKALSLALSLLTRIPVNQIDEIQPQDSGHAALYYPLIGLLIGLLLYLPIVFFTHTSPNLLAAIIVCLWAIITGGLHLDGLADSADAWLGGTTTEKTHRIMKDPLVGSAGVIAICCLLILKFSAISTLIQNNLGWMIILAPAIGRCMILLLFLTTEYVRNQGMAMDVIRYLPKNTAWMIIIICLVIASIASLSATFLVLIGFYFSRRLMLKRLKGCTGDTAGAIIETSEALFLVGAALSYS